MAGLLLANQSCAPLAEAPELHCEEFAGFICGRITAGARLASLFGVRAEGETVLLYAVLAQDGRGQLEIARTRVAEAYPALTPTCPQAHLFEREIWEQFGVEPMDHPWLKPVRYHAPASLGNGGGPRPEPCCGEFFRMAGPEVHEVAVGPVHAGIIEPGHFRFQCLGETVHHLEIALGYQHRGAEALLAGGPDARTVHLMEALAGDTSIGHAWAYAGAVEALAGTAVPARGQALRAAALELERLANHTGDLGALAGDVGFLPTLSFCGRLRGDYLNLSALICGSRFGRGLVRPGGCACDVDAPLVDEILRRLEGTFRDTCGAAELMFGAGSVQSRFEGTGTIDARLALDLGLVGPPARACGLVRDVRRDFALPGYGKHRPTVAYAETGDVWARAQVRWREAQASAAFVRERLTDLPAGPVHAQTGALKPEHLAVSLVEGWRGEVCHVAITDQRGRFARYKVTDPSFHNWMGLAMALRMEAISDFPLCNKSFNLSYCGHDL
jgi:Ni,Fe-hydrogenase III large subunit